MPSHMLAFVVSDLFYVSNIDTKEGGDTIHRVWVRLDSITKVNYALEISSHALKVLEDYVGFKYELLKVDSVGLPNKIGATENWGMLTYR